MALSSLLASFAPVVKGAGSAAGIKLMDKLFGGGGSSGDPGYDSRTRAEQGVMRSNIQAYIDQLEAGSPEYNSFLATAQTEYGKIAPRDRYHSQEAIISAGTSAVSQQSARLKKLQQQAQARADKQAKETQSRQELAELQATVDERFTIFSEVLNQTQAVSKQDALQTRSAVDTVNRQLGNISRAQNESKFDPKILVIPLLLIGGFLFLRGKR